MHPSSSVAAAQPTQGTAYRYVLDKGSGTSLEFEAAGGVFFPTSTSQLLIAGARRSIPSPGTLLDVGCGIGLCGVVLAKLGLCRSPVYLSDVSERATGLAARNAAALGVPAVVRQGSLLAPWRGERFDVIVNDVSGICEGIAKVSPWFPNGVACHTGADGCALVVELLTQAPSYLTPGGLLLFPVLSLSREASILDAAHSVFAEVTLVAEQVWFLPEELLKRFDVLQPLLDAGTISLEYKFGAWLWSTKIYQARGPSGAA